MNKKLLSIAVASAIVAPLAAQADEGNVTLYGSTNLAIEATDNGAESQTNVSSNQSVIGVKGFEPLGNGLRAVFLFDALMNLDSGGPSLFAGGRDGWVGLAGGFGTVGLGFQGRPYKTSTNNLDVFGSTIADYSNIMGTSQGVTLLDTGIGNSVIWFGPDLGGFSWHLQYGVGETEIATAGVVDEADQWGAAINYNNGPLYATYSHDVLGEDLFGGVDDVTSDKLGLSLTFGSATTLTAIYEQIETDFGIFSAGDFERDAFYVAFAQGFGSNTIKLAYGEADESEGAFGEDGAEMFAVGVDHNFSKRTKVYLLYTEVSNDTNGIYGLGDTAAGGLLTSTGAVRPVAFGEDLDSIAFGVKHDF